MIGASALVAIIAFIIVLNTVIIPNVRYNNLISGNFEIGDTVCMGDYHGTIEWLVLDKQGNNAMLISKYGLDCKEYNEKNNNVTWTLREWLNIKFINEAFTDEQKNKILTTYVNAEKNPTYDTNPGYGTEDKIFLLSIQEAEQYFKSSDARQCKPTSYAVGNGAFKDDKTGNCLWWLRSPGNIQDYAAYVSTDGSVDYYGQYVNYYRLAVRPALWINLD